MENPKKYLRSIQDLFDKFGIAEPPNSTELEQAVLGGMILHHPTQSKIVSIFGPRNGLDTPFWDIRNHKIYEVIFELEQQGIWADRMVLTNALRTKRLLVSADDYVYVIGLTSDCLVTQTEAYAKIVYEKYLQREVIRVCKEVELRAKSGEEEVFELIDDGARTLSDLNDLHSKTGRKSLPDQTFDTIHVLEQAEGSVLGISGIRSGFNDIDRLTSGWQNGDLIILAARTSMGKTALSLDFVRGALGLTINGHSESAKHVYYVSKEMPATQIILRMLCSLGQIEIQRARQGKLTEDEWRRINRAAIAIKDSPLIIEDSRKVTFNEIRSRARRLKQQGKLDLLVVDYLQKLATGEQDLYKEITKLSADFANLLLELEVPGIILSQLNRGLENRQEKRPQLSDIRQSGAIEQDAALVGFIYRPEVYGIMTDEHGQPTAGRAEFILAKHRNGPTGTADLVFHKEFARFEEKPLELDNENGW